VTEGVKVEMVTAAVAGRASKFGPLFSRDPVDRLITATAIELGVPLATSDRPIMHSGVVEVLSD
jgi:PIN domain nuclease of toxin-antitoxin system